jgi:hypothetical protein
MSKVIAYNFATEEKLSFDEEYRCVNAAAVTDVSHPPFMTSGLDNLQVKKLRDMIAGDVVFIEWEKDRFYKRNLESHESFEDDHVPGLVVWRKARILEV